MPRLDECRPRILETLLPAAGPNLAPGVGPTGVPDPFGAVASAALALVAEPRIASAALEALRGAGLLEAGALAEVDPLELDELFRSEKIRLSARSLRPLQRIARWAADRGFDAERADAISTESLREEWRALNGVGPATADQLLLFGLGRPAYPVDRATYRIFLRHGWLDPSADYDEARSVAESLAPEDPVTLARISRALVRLGRESCKPTVARCDRCPLRSMLPPDGPIKAGE